MDWQIPREELLGSGKLLGQGKFGIVIKTIWRGTPVAIKRFHEYDNNNTITILDEFKNISDVLLKMKGHVGYISIGITHYPPLFPKSTLNTNV